MYEEIKSQLAELIDASPAINSLPADAKAARKKLMLSADEETMYKFIDVLENEKVEMEKIDDEFAAEAEEIDALLNEATQLEKEAEREIRKEEEEAERAGDLAKADALLAELDEIQEESN
ncbi:hypothetical protein KKC45_00415 [Patescibacteria group bacterium]|nr:hypothetical protein [Patescibacteria group bacterium]